MTARSAATIVSVVLLAAVSGCTNFFEVPIETPISAKMDVTAFQRVLVAGFISGGSDDVDANLETVRLLRSQLRSKSPLRIIEAEVLPLAEIAAAESRAAAENGRTITTTSTGVTPISPVPTAEMAKPAEAPGAKPDPRKPVDLNIK